MGENKKIKGASSVIVDDIVFRSKLESKVYGYLKSIGITPKYECMSVKIWDREHFSVPYYDRFGKTFKRITSKPISVRYTPDFVFDYGNYKVILEVKGFKNDVANYKIRMFRDWLEDAQISTGLPKYCYAVVYSIKDVKTLLSDLDKTM